MNSQRRPRQQSVVVVEHNETKKQRNLTMNTSLIQSLLQAELNQQDLFKTPSVTPAVSSTNLTITPTVKKPADCDFLTEDIIQTNLLNKSQLNQVCTSLRLLERKLNNFNIKSTINKIFIVTKIYDDDPIEKTMEMVEYLLVSNPNVEVYVQDELTKCKAFHYDELLEKNISFRSRIKLWSADVCLYNNHIFDLVITLGGDGTVLFASWLFQTVIPPILTFGLGSLGFLTQFDIGEQKTILDRVLNEGYKCAIRMRFECTIMRSSKYAKDYINDHKDDPSEPERDLIAEIKSANYCTPNSLAPFSENSICKFTTHRILETYTVFNDLVIDRGPNTTMTSLEMFGDYSHLTTSEADGLVVSTTNGSTAYSLSAGGSLIHPEIPGILITPICPHTLSFRPLVIPESLILRIGVPYDARTTAWCSFDGRNKVELNRGDFVTITTSRYPLTNIINDQGDADDIKTAWFKRLSETLHWNERKRQKAFTNINH